MCAWIVDYRTPGERDHHFTIDADSFYSAEMKAEDALKKMQLPEGSRVLRVYPDADTVPDDDTLVLVSAQQSRHDFS